MAVAAALYQHKRGEAAQPLHIHVPDGKEFVTGRNSIADRRAVAGLPDRGIMDVHSQVELAISSCQRLSAQEKIAQCLAGLPLSKDGPLIGRMLCRGMQTQASGWPGLLMNAVFDQSSVEEVWSILAHMEAECLDDQSLADLLSNVLEQRRAADSQWARSLAGALQPEELFGSGKQTAARLLGLLLRAGWEELRPVVELAAYGEFGASPVQVDHCILHAGLSQPTSADVIAFTAGILQNAEQMKTPRSAGAAISVLLRDDVWQRPDRDAAEICALVDRCLSSAEVEIAAAAQVLSLDKGRKGPSGSDAALWGALWNKAESIAHHHRLIIGGKSY